MQVPWLWGKPTAYSASTWVTLHHHVGHGGARETYGNTKLMLFAILWSNKVLCLYLKGLVSCQINLFACKQGKILKAGKRSFGLDTCLLINSSMEPKTVLLLYLENHSPNKCLILYDICKSFLFIILFKSLYLLYSILSVAQVLPSKIKHAQCMNFVFLMGPELPIPTQQSLQTDMYKKGPWGRTQSSPFSSQILKSIQYQKLLMIMGLSLKQMQIRLS